MKFKLRVTPKARTNSLIGWGSDKKILKIKVCAAPDKGKANEAVIKLLAKELHCSSSSIKIVGGETSRDKTVQIPKLLYKKLREEENKNSKK